MKSELEETLALHLRAEKIPHERKVLGLVPGRKYEADFLVDGWLVVECQGGIWKKGGHSSGKGITRDCEKASQMLLNGYPTMAVTLDQIRSGDAISWIKQLVEKEREVI